MGINIAFCPPLSFFILRDAQISINAVKNHTGNLSFCSEKNNLLRELNEKNQTKAFKAT